MRAPIAALVLLSSACVTTLWYANSRSSSGVVPTRPACHTTPSCQIATCAKSRWTSNPMHRLPITCHLQPYTARTGGRRAKRHLRIRAHGATGQVAGAANY